NNALWSFRAIAANLPYINVLFINVAQAIIAVFLASDFLKRDKKLDTTEVIYARPITNGEYVVGKTLGILVLFVGLVLLALLMTLVFNLVRKDVPVEWETYLYYPLLITIPTLVFILGLSFFMMILFRSQAVTFLVLLGYIGLTLFYFQDKLYGMLDYMAFNLPMVYSDFIGFADFRLILLHRLAYFLLGSGFIFATIRFLNRLPQTGRWNGLNLIGFIGFIAGGLFVGSLYFNSYRDQSREREAFLELNNTYAGKHISDVLSNELQVEQHGRSLQISSFLRVQNQNTERLDTLLFSLNTGFKIDSITSRSEKVEYIRKKQLLMLIPSGGLEAGRRRGFTIYYRGVPDESVAYLDIPREQMNASKRIMVAPINKKPGIIHPDYLLLTPELNWYPVAGVGFNLETFQPREPDYTRFSLTVGVDSTLTAIAPGKLSTDERGIHFNPEQDLNAFPLVLAPLERRSMEIDGVEYNLYLDPEHDYFSDYFQNIQDTIKALIKEAKDDWELDELDLYYEFRRINLVEVPIQFHAYERPYSQTVEYILPEMILLPEKGTGLSTFDFHRFKWVAENRDRRDDNTRSPREIETDMFKRLLQNTFFRTETRSRGRGGFGGGDRGEKLITYQGDVDYNKNPYCVFPLYYSYVTGISSWDYPVFNSMLEIYLKEGFDVSPREGFTGGITDKERANLLLSRNSVVDLFARWDTELTASLINQTGSFIISALKNRVGMGDFDYFFYYYLEDHAFSEITFEQFSRDFYDEFGVEVAPYLEVMNAGGEMPTFLISEPEYLQTRDDIGDVYLVKFSISNVGFARGLVDFNFRIMGQGGFGGGGGMSEEKRLYEVDAGETREVQVVLYDRPMMMTVNTLISGNIPSSYNNFLRSATEVTTTNQEEYDRYSTHPVSFRYEDEYVVDNEDEGFTHFSVSRESKLKQYVDSRKVKDEGLLYESLNEWWTPSRWTPVAHAAYYGETVRSAMAIRRGDGSNYVNWSTVLPEKGFYDLYVYIPVSAMYQRPSRRDQGGGQAGQGSGQGRGFGPEFADKGTDYHYSIFSSEGTEEVVYELNNPEDGWNRLGSFHLPADSVRVQLSNQTDGRRVIADAVKWVRRR
ncbi:MAG: ABC transporter permease subunit, partial [Bacteroidota bacterium]|nr:ABC transporter permease subunit [Bacteroidota bacterium]